MKLTSLIVLVLLFSLSCKKNKKDYLPSKKTITTFNLKASLNTGLSKDLKGHIDGDTIRLAVPAAIGMTNLKPSVTHTGKSISPGDAINQDFSNPVEYTVTAEDESTKKYIVIVRFQNSSKELFSFSFSASDNTGVLTQDAMGVIEGDSILVTTDAFHITNLIPTITHNGEQIYPTSGQSNSFINPAFYTVTAEDGTLKKYTVIVKTTASVFVGGMDANLYAFDAGNGKLRWKFPLSLAADLNPTYADETVFIGNNYYLYALDGATGTLKWNTRLPAVASTSPQVAGNLVYIAVQGNSGSSILAIDKNTGTIRWKDPINTPFVLCNPTVAEGRLLTAGFHTGLRCYNAETGDSLWTFGMGIIRDNAAVVNGTLYLGSESYRMIAIDMATGLKKWALPSYRDYNINQTFTGVGSTPTVHNGILYTGGGPLRAYDIETGSLKWEYLIDYSEFSRPVVENGTIFGTTRGEAVFAINSDGTLKWQHGRLFTSVDHTVPIANATVANNVVFTGAGLNNKLVALNAENGKLIWAYEGTSPFTSGPCVVDGKNKVFHSNTSGAQN